MTSQRTSVVRAMICLLVGAAAGALGARWASSPPGPVAVAPSSSPSASLSAETAAPIPEPPAPGTAIDPKALKELEARDDRARSAADAEAIARMRITLLLADLASLESAMAAHPEIAGERATLARLHDLITKEPVAVEALAVVARMNAPEATDLLYAEWRRRGPTTLGLLARDLLREEHVRARASDALQSTMELEELLEKRPADGPHLVRRCQSVEKTLSRLADVGDKRAAPLLQSLFSRTGCGPAATDDCHVCLRVGDVLARAKEGTATREAPTPYLLPGRSR